MKQVTRKKPALEIITVSLYLLWLNKLSCQHNPVNWAYNSKSPIKSSSSYWAFVPITCCSAADCDGSPTSSSAEFKPIASRAFERGREIFTRRACWLVPPANAASRFEPAACVGAASCWFVPPANVASGFEPLNCSLYSSSESEGAWNEKKRKLNLHSYSLMA